MDPLWLVNFAARSILLARLFRLGFPSDWPFLAGLLFVSLSQSMVLMVFRPDTNVYAIAWMISTVILMIATVLATMEAIHRLCEEFPGTERNANQLILWLTVFALLIATATLFSDLQAAYAKSSMRGIFITIVVGQRYISTVLAAGLILGWLFFRPYPARRKREVTLNYGFLTIWFSLVAISFWLFNLGNLEYQKIATKILLSADAICLGLWAILIRKPETRLVIRGDRAAVDAGYDKIEAHLKRGEDSLRR